MLCRCAAMPLPPFRLSSFPQNCENPRFNSGKWLRLLQLLLGERGQKSCWFIQFKKAHIKKSCNSSSSSSSNNKTADTTFACFVWLWFIVKRVKEEEEVSIKGDKYRERQNLILFFPFHKLPLTPHKRLPKSIYPVTVIAICCCMLLRGSYIMLLI